MDPMVITSRYEELEDYAELDGLLSADEIPIPGLSRCFVHRDDTGTIDGYCFIQTIVVVEPIWVAPSQRGKMIAPRLFNQAVEALAADGNGTARHFVVHAVNPEIENYMRRLGAKDAGRTFVMEVPNGQHR